MSAEGYLELHFQTVDPRHGTVLLGSKRWLPGGWFWFFEAADFHKQKTPDEGVFTLLVRPWPEAIALARRRQAALKAVVTNELALLLETLITTVEKAGRAEAFVVLNSHRLESSKAELTRPLKWLAALEARPDARGVRKLDAAFDEDADEGLYVETDDDDVPRVHMTSAVGVTGWPAAAAADDDDDDADDEGQEEEE